MSDVMTNESITAPVNKAEEQWERIQERQARLQEAQIAELADVVRHRAVAEVHWDREEQRVVEHRAKWEKLNERLVMATERQADALERIAKAAESKP